MALQKQIVNNNITANYWKISGINVSYTGKIAQIFIMGYTTKEDRDKAIENKVVFENHICKGTDFDTYFATGVLDVVSVNPINSAYKYLKEKVGVFADSVDV